MKIPTIHQQMFGDLNKHLNNIRAQMNEEIREKCFEILEKKRETNDLADIKKGEQARCQSISPKA